MNFTLRFFTLAGLVVALASPLHALAAKLPSLTQQGDSFILQPKPATGPVVNPGKGWILYSKPGQTPPEALAIGSLGYARYNWATVEPKEGDYHWEIIDRDLEGWSKLGKQFAFRVMGANAHSKEFWVTPKYVFDAGAPYTQTELIDAKSAPAGTPMTRLNPAGTPLNKLVPVFDDPIYMQKVEKFVRALAAHYDGNPNLAFIDIGSYGNWGESHMYPISKHEISPEKYQEHLAIYRNAFKKTLLEVCFGREIYRDVFTWAAKNGIGMRCDGIGANRDGSEVLFCVGQLPAVFEFFASYETMAELGYWYGKKNKYGYGHRLKDCVETGKPTWCSLSDNQKGLKLLADERPLVESLANRLGYHFVLQQIQFPAVFTRSNPAMLESKWENQGVAPIFIPAALSYALLDDRGQVVEECAAPSAKPAEWKPDQAVTVCDRVVFSKAKPGSYFLAVGLKRLSFVKPTIRIAIEAETSDGWQILGKVNVKQ
ncbi:MAG: DUF4832 domain-containing protein [Verrucomicrobia bacterium]|nr:DUF4832 domain-containing protein [Verrucomicrobiota bacterium]